MNENICIVFKLVFTPFHSILWGYSKMPGILVCLPSTKRSRLICLSENDTSDKYYELPLPSFTFNLVCLFFCIEKKLLSLLFYRLLKVFKWYMYNIFSRYQLQKHVLISTNYQVDQRDDMSKCLFSNQKLTRVPVRVAICPSCQVKLFLQVSCFSLLEKLTIPSVRR